MMKGLIIAGTNNLFTVECDDEVTRNCTIKGKVLKSDKQFYNPLAPGDIVEIEVDPLNDAKGQILSLEPRKNTFLRWNVKGRCPQLLASNLDYLILVTTPDEPPFRPRFTDRALVQAEHQGITPIVICNKWDLAEKMQEANPEKINVEYIDPDLNPQFISSYEDEALGTGMERV